MDSLETIYFVVDPPIEEIQARLKVPRVHFAHRTSSDVPIKSHAVRYKYPVLSVLDDKARKTASIPRRVHARYLTL